MTLLSVKCNALAMPYTWKVLKTVAAVVTAAAAAVAAAVVVLLLLNANYILSCVKCILPKCKSHQDVLTCKDKADHKK